jgi:hypothetical protein
MIRRHGSIAEGTAGQWILISQIDHARLAGQLAEHWGADGYAPLLLPRNELLWTVYHHDDGWHAWEQAPDVDPKSGKPRTFTEMELGDSLVIWTASIETARQEGPLQAYLVAGHFCALARRSAAWRKHDALWPQAERFLDQFGSLGTHWLQEWQAENPTANTPQRAQQALAQLQFFDALSLWFCCAAASGPDRIETPAGPVLTLVPVDPRRVHIAPWPLNVESLDLEIAGRAVPVGRYRDRAELAAAPAQSVLLRWQLQHGEQNVDVRT